MGLGFLDKIPSVGEVWIFSGTTQGNKGLVMENKEEHVIVLDIKSACILVGGLLYCEAT